MDKTRIVYICVSRGEISPKQEFCHEDLAEQLVEIASQSAYAASPANTRAFVAEAFALHNEQATRKSLFVALHETETLGFLEMRVDIDDAEIDFVAVDPAFRRLGIGKRLVSNSVQHAIAHGAQRVLLEVGESNEAAVSLYRELGFSQISMRKNYYKNGENALVMERRISAAS